jgi:hypothetical protein
LRFGARINDHYRPGVIISLAPWIEVIDPIGRRLDWSTHYMWGLCADDRGALLAPEPSRLLRELQCDTTWDEIRAMSEVSHQLIDGVLIGRLPGTPVPSFRTRLTLPSVASADLAEHWIVWLEAFDSAYWWISTSSQELAERVQRSFKEIDVRSE